MKPRLILKLSIRTLQSKIFRLVKLRYVDICVSARCNLKCEHCFSENFKNREGEDSSRRDKEFNLNEWAWIIRECKKAGVLSFGITGGEPLLYNELENLIRIIDSRDSYITINSNGLLFTEQKAESLRKLGVDAMLFSLDSADAEFHNAFRHGDKAFEKTLEAVRLALKYKFKVCIVCTVSHENIKSKGVLSLVELTKKMGVLLIFSRAAPVGKWRGRMDILLDRSDQEYMYQLVHRHFHVRTDFEANILKRGCSAGTEKLYITPYGDVLPCPFMHISFGNIISTPIEIIRERVIKRLGFYAQTCFVSENQDFIDRHLSKTFTRPSVYAEKECF
jgi:MoaA/NifB/PqqE/SkfB family radical SAM enzyme